eukprot:CAMPEP_0184652202 /NCGR_PEP_ID=MMETSP0308-20130426/9898_1 /TAXON_ID=38269 /ORGANISM="Gloeochaete witrockiana, Strain SAG 46.84" /LENGTH=276 /DNA_ID=CAMNT_0027086935 /DNA_START=44 /DNA_END=874 /DNA_ORIENTATION=-
MSIRRSLYTASRLGIRRTAAAADAAPSSTARRSGFTFPIAVGLASIVGGVSYGYYSDDEWRMQLHTHAAPLADYIFAPIANGVASLFGAPSVAPYLPPIETKVPVSPPVSVDAPPVVTTTATEKKPCCHGPSTPVKVDRTSLMGIQAAVLGLELYLAKRDGASSDKISELQSTLAAVKKAPSTNVTVPARALIGTGAKTWNLGTDLEEKLLVLRLREKIVTAQILSKQASKEEPKDIESLQEQLGKILTMKTELKKGKELDLPSLKMPGLAPVELQ